MLPASSIGSQHASSILDSDTYDWIVRFSAAVGSKGVGLTGVSWSASIMARKFLGADGSGYTSDAVRAINCAALQRLRYGVNVRVIVSEQQGQGGGETVSG